MINQPRLFNFVIPYSRLAWLVESATRSGIFHLVDLEGYERQPIVCTCEDFIYNRNKHCHHIRAVATQI